MTEIANAVEVARLELGRLSAGAKQHIHDLLGEAFAELGTEREHVIAIGKKLHDAFGNEVAPLATVDKIASLEDSLSEALQAKAALEDSLSEALQAKAALEARVGTLLENNQAANEQIGKLEAQVADLRAKLAPQAEAPAPPAVAPAGEVQPQP